MDKYRGSASQQETHQRLKTESAKAGEHARFAWPEAWCALAPPAVICSLSSELIPVASASTRLLSIASRTWLRVSAQKTTMMVKAVMKISIAILSMILTQMWLQL